MAHRLSTEYTRAMLEIAPSQFDRFLQLFRGKNFKTEVKDCGRCSREVLIYTKDTGKPLTFRSTGRFYEFVGSYRIHNLELAGVIRSAIQLFRGFALVHRIHHGFVMIYQYEHGTVVKITEKSGGRERIIYEYANRGSRLEWLYRCRDAEREIEAVKTEIDLLLDRRNKDQQVVLVDTRLKELAHRLFILEA